MEVGEGNGVRVSDDELSIWPCRQPHHGKVFQQFAADGTSSHLSGQRCCSSPSASWILCSLPVPWALPTHHQVLLVTQLLLEIGPEDSNLAIVARASLPGQGAV